jgi:Uma2 family endonuclease
MYATAERPLTFEEFLAWDDGSGRDFELRDGYPMPITDPNAKHEDVVHHLCISLDSHCVEKDLLYVPRQSKQVLLKPNAMTGRQESRKADIVVFAKDEWEKMRNSSSSAAAYISPPLVIEVVSSNWKDDYESKVGEYEEAGISEYWIVDYAGIGGIRFIGKPKQPTITIYTLTEEQEYQPKQFRGNTLIESLVFPTLQLTADQIFAMATL